MGELGRREDRSVGGGEGRGGDLDEEIGGEDRRDGGG